ncbi:hypothetical protein [Stutzerimonas azotifigens]|uniref:DUF7847 domain-containing protein n=1 Tax=Stutzerimonas azotifigens TaxID=291995 RepID=A0ABR5YUZ8_9GAMM|nr:hypothetical protein [Stutzerimonas azotifigens]MBA1271746.1 hypothetical protein [Stutzerimonas azotifigens]
MNPFAILRDACYFYSRHLTTIAVLCLPLILAESLAQQLVASWTADSPSTAYELLVGLIFYPLYLGALILFLDARSHGHSPAPRDLLVRAAQMWPAFAVVAALGTLLIMLGASLFVLPGIWIMVRICFAEYLLVLRGLSPLDAIKQSFAMTRGHFLPLFGCLVTVMLPLWLVGFWISAQRSSDAPLGLLPAVLLDSALGMLQLFASIVVYRLYMLLEARRQSPETD